MTRARKMGLGLGAATLGILAGPVLAAPQTFLGAGADPEVHPSFFTLEFPGLGETVSDIAYTEFDLEVDPDTGVARFLWYYQEAGSLDLPTGNPDFPVIPTGALTIRIVPGSSSGSFDDETEVFTTSEDYAIYFENDLSVFGFDSPALLPGSSTGDLSVVGAAGGVLTLEWGGSGELVNPSNPAETIPFLYTCNVSADVSAAPSCAVNDCDTGDVTGDCMVDSQDLTQVLQSFGAAGLQIPARDAGDVNYDGVIDSTDLSLLLKNFGNDCN